MPTSPDWAQIDDIFAEALALPPGGRESYVASRTSDAEIREEVLSLLRHAMPEEPDSIVEAAVLPVALEFLTERNRARKGLPS